MGLLLGDVQLAPVSVGLKFGFLAVLYLFLMWVAWSALRDLRRIIGRLARRQRALIKFGAQAGAFQKFGDDEGRAAILPDIVNGKNIGVVERSYGPSFLLEAPQPIGIARKGFRQHFQRNFTPKPRVAGAIHFAHAPGT